MKLTQKQVEDTLKNANLSYEDVDNEFFMDEGQFKFIVMSKSDIPEPIIRFIKDAAMVRLSKTRRKTYERQYSGTSLGKKWNWEMDNNVLSAICNGSSLDDSIMSEIRGL